MRVAVATAALAAAAVLAGCTPSDPCAGRSGSCIALRVTGAVAGLDQLSVGLDRPTPKRMTTPEKALTLPTTIGLNLPVGFSGAVAIDVVGLAHGQALASGHTQATVVDGRGAAEVALSGAGAPPPDMLPPSGPAVTVSPAAATVAAAHALSFSASEPVTWSVVEAGGGFVDGSGGYVAPDAPGGYHVLATSVAAPTRSAMVPVTVTPLTLTLIAGGLGGPGNLDGFGTAARFGSTLSLLFPLVSDADNHRIRKIDTFNNDRVTTVVGSSAGDADGPGAMALLDRPRGLAQDAAGNIYVADSGNGKIRKIDSSYNVTTLASGLGTPIGLVADLANNRLLVADQGKLQILAVALSGGAVTVVAGSGSGGNLDNSVGSMATFMYPSQLALNGNTLEVLDNGLLRTVDLTSGGTYAVVTHAQPSPIYLTGLGQGSFTTASALYQVAADYSATLVAGVEGTLGSADGPVASARFESLDGVENGSWLADGPAVRELNAPGASGTITTLAGLLANPAVDGTGSAAGFALVTGAGSDGVGKLWASETQRLRSIDLATGTVTSLALAAPVGARNLVWYAGQLYGADAAQQTLTRIDPATGAVTVIAGTAGSSGFVDGVGAAARFNLPSYLASDGNGTLYLADVQNNSIRSVDVASGAVTTLAGSGSAGASDGIGAAASFSRPDGLALDGQGALYVADRGNYVVRKVTLASGAVERFAGVFATRGYADGPRLQATFEGPWSLACDGHSLYVSSLPADGMTPVQSIVRRVDLGSGVVSTFMGQLGLDGLSVGPLPATLSQQHFLQQGPLPLVITPAGDLAVFSAGALLLARP